jgi:hypothetical protein
MSTCPAKTSIKPGISKMMANSATAPAIQAACNRPNLEMAAAKGAPMNGIRTMNSKFMK